MPEPWVVFRVWPNDWWAISGRCLPGLYIRQGTTVDLRRRFTSQAQARAVCKRLNQKEAS